MSEVVWGDPPPRVHGVRRSPWLARLAPFLERPGEWGRIQIPDGAGVHWERDAVANLNRRQVQVPPGRWEFTYRTVPERGLWARYLGPEDD